MPSPVPHAWLAQLGQVHTPCNLLCEQVRAEVDRLEGRKAALMRHMITLKRRDLEEVCAAAHMLPPPLPPVDAAAEACGGAAASAQARPSESAWRRSA